MDRAEVIALKLIAMRALGVVALMQPNPKQFLADQRQAALNDARAVTISGNAAEEKIRAQVREEIEDIFGAVTLSVPHMD